MPFIAQDLLKGKHEPVTVQLGDSAQRAVEVMIKHNYSQLPVIDPTGRPIGLVTGDSIVVCVANLRLTPKQLKIDQVVEKVERVYPTDYPIFDLLSGLNDSSAVLIVHPDGRLAGIVTNWDTADYFRRRAVVMMMLEDIEILLREHIRAAFARTYGRNADEKLQAAIDEVTNTSAQRAKVVKGALNEYVNLAELRHSPREDLMKRAFSKIIGKPTESQSLEKLTFADYVQLLLYKSAWPAYSTYLAIPQESLFNLLDEVRESRNAVAHFTREITAWERQSIEYCVRVLQDLYPPAITEREDQIAADVQDPSTFDDDEVSDDSMYAPLAKFLRDQPDDMERLVLSFDEIERVLGTELPASARIHRSWWANDSVSHVQSKQWLSVNWRVAGVSMTDGKITFSRNKKLEQARISFFSSLLNELRSKAKFDVYDVSPSGAHWITAQAYPPVNQQAWLNLSFALSKQFRVELYIDAKDEKRNSDIFDHLYTRKSEIEQRFGSELRWEPLETKRACRIAVYHDGSITDTDEKLADLRKWAVDATIRFEKAISDKVEEALHTVS